jgi:hypothetical protein
MGITVLVSDGDDGAAGFYGASGNAPPSKSIYCPVGGCVHTSTACPAISILHESTGHTCVFPTGSGSGVCQITMQSNYFLGVVYAFLDANKHCNVGIDVDVENNYNLYSTCACSELKSTTTHSFKVSGYSFSPKNGAIFTPDFPTSSPWGNNFISMLTLFSSSYLCWCFSIPRRLQPQHHC